MTYDLEGRLQAGTKRFQLLDDKMDWHAKDTVWGQRDELDPRKVFSVPARLTHGPMQYPVLWQTPNHAKDPRVWSYCAPAAYVEDEYRPILGPKWSDLYEINKLEARVFKDQRYPEHWPFFVAHGFEHKKQTPLALPGFAGLVAPYVGGETEHGTPVWDLDAIDQVDDERRARLQTMLRVYRYPVTPVGLTWSDGFEPAGVAWQWGDAGRIGGNGMVADYGQQQLRNSPNAGGVFVAQGPGLQTFGVSTYRGGGPGHVGSPVNDPHRIGLTPDGEIINALHSSTRTLFFGHNADQPLDFGGIWQKTKRAPFLVPTYLRNDQRRSHNWAFGSAQGIWAWQSEAYFTEVDKWEPPLGDPLPPLVENPDGTKVEPNDPMLLGEGTHPRDGVMNGKEQIQYAQMTGRCLFGTPLMLAGPGSVGRPQLYKSGVEDLRYWKGPLNKQGGIQFSIAPATFKTEYAGIQRSHRDWRRTTLAGRGYYGKAGTASGAQVLMPPELGLEMSFISGNLPSYSSTGQILWNVWQGWGLPLFDEETEMKVGSGFVTELSSGELVTSSTDSSGAKTEVMAIGSDCVDVACLKIDGVESYSVLFGVLTSNETVVNTTTNTKVFAPEITGDTLEVGQVVELTLDGTIRNETAMTTTSVQIRAYFDGEVFFDSGSISLDPTSAAQFRIETGFTVRTIGATGTIRPHQGRYTIPDGTGGPTEGLTDDNDADHTVDTTSNQEVQIKIQFGDADSAIEAIAINARCRSMR